MLRQGLAPFTVLLTSKDQPFSNGPSPAVCPTTEPRPLGGAPSPKVTRSPVPTWGPRQSRVRGRQRSPTRRNHIQYKKTPDNHQHGETDGPGATRGSAGGRPRDHLAHPPSDTPLGAPAARRRRRLPPSPRPRDPSQPAGGAALTGQEGERQQQPEDPAQHAALHGGAQAQVAQPARGVSAALIAAAPRRLADAPRAGGRASEAGRPAGRGWARPATPRRDCLAPPPSLPSGRGRSPAAAGCSPGPASGRRLPAHPALGGKDRPAPPQGLPRPPSPPPDGRSAPVRAARACLPALLRLPAAPQCRPGPFPAQAAPPSAAPAPPQPQRAPPGQRPAAHSSAPVQRATASSQRRRGRAGESRPLSSWRSGHVAPEAHLSPLFSLAFGAPAWHPPPVCHQPASLAPQPQEMQPEFISILSAGAISFTHTGLPVFWLRCNLTVPGLKAATGPPGSASANPGLPAAPSSLQPFSPGLPPLEAPPRRLSLQPAARGRGAAAGFCPARLPAREGLSPPTAPGGLRGRGAFKEAGPAPRPSSRRGRGPSGSRESWIHSAPDGTLSGGGGL
uniref:basic proline-rich protein-like n=1 Tax=Euleptes europaea TaxID=460621 RepID=UPI0025406E7D|nr:basic proline-rich protein-like [Euleptes europaea]